MNSIEFINNYELFLDEISKVVKPEFQHIVKELKEKDPHDLITPDTYLSSVNEARGYVWGLFISKARKNINL